MLGKMLAHKNSSAMNPPNLGSSSASQVDVEHKSELRPIGDGSIALRVVIHREKITDRRPLVIINSVDFPMPPSIEFCEQMWRAGYQVIFIERPGFGSSRPLPDVLLENAHIQSGATVAAEAALLCAMLRQLALKEIVLLTMGSANPVGYRMANLHPEIERLWAYSRIEDLQNRLDSRSRWRQRMHTWHHSPFLLEPSRRWS